MDPLVWGNVVRNLISIKRTFHKFSDSGIGNSTELKEGKAVFKLGVSSSNGIRSDVINLAPRNWLVSSRVVPYVCQSVLLAGWIFSHGRSYISLGERELILLCPHLVSTPVTMAMPFMNISPSTGVAMERGPLTSKRQVILSTWLLTLLIHCGGCSWLVTRESIIFSLYAFSS